METYHKIQTLFKRDMDGSITGQKGKMIEGAWTTPELEYLAGNEWEFTEKVDGTNIRILLSRYEDDLRCVIGGRTNNAIIPNPLLTYLSNKFKDSPRGSGESAHIGRWMVDNNLTEVILFGEGYGPKIQGGGKYRDDHSFVLFDVKIGNWWLNRDDVDDIAVKLGIESVPVVGHGTLYDGIRKVAGGPEIVFVGEQELDVWRHPMRSTWGDFEAEGIVARPSVPMFDRKGQRIITKIKAVDFR